MKWNGVTPVLAHQMTSFIAPLTFSVAVLSAPSAVSPVESVCPRADFLRVPLCRILNSLEPATEKRISVFLFRFVKGCIQLGDDGPSVIRHDNEFRIDLFYSIGYTPH
jgi:hypothetical protein